MKPVLIVGSILLGLSTQQAAAQTCNTGARLTVAQLAALLPGKYACYGPGAWPAVTWNERHSGGAGSISGSVTDFKKGPTDPVDPTSVVGTYSITQNIAAKSGQVTYNYGAGGTYSYYVFANLGTKTPSVGNYSFCTTGGGINIPVTVGLSTAHGGCP